MKINNIKSNKMRTFTLAMLATLCNLAVAQQQLKVYCYSTVTFQPVPATITVDPVNITVCEYTNSQFTVLASGDEPITYQWQINNGSGWSDCVPGGAFSIVTDDTLIITSTPASFTGYGFRCIVNNGCGGDTSNTAILTVSVPVVTLNANSPLCEGDNLTISENGTGAVSWSWAGPNGFTSTNQVNNINNIIPSQGGTYNCTVTDVNGCTAWNFYNVDVNPKPTLTITTSGTPVCEGSSVSVSAVGAFMYNWSGGISNGVPFVPSATSSYTVSGTSSQGCVGTAEVTITVVPLPNVNLGGDIVHTMGVPATLDAGAGFTSYQWSTAETTRTIEVSAAGDYSVTVSDSYGCINSDTINVSFVPAVCEASISLDSTQVLNAYFTNTSSGAFSDVFWDFGDGTFSNDANSLQMHTYTNSGFYTVCLTINNTLNGCIDDTCITIEILPLPINCNANFTYTDMGVSQASFNSVSDGVITNFYWEFGNGGVSYDMNPNYTFPMSGYYNVKLTVRDSVNECVSTIEKTITVGSPSNDCEAKFTYYSDLPAKIATFQSNSVGQGIDQYLWNFGDGQFDNNISNTHQYQNAAFHNVCLTIASSSTGCSHTKCQVIKVGNDPNSCHAKFTYSVDTADVSKANSGKNVTFKGTAFGDPAKAVWSILWNFGDGTTNTTDWMPQHTYQDTGLYLVHFHIEGNTCSDDYFDLINLLPNSIGFRGKFGTVMHNHNKANQRPVSFKGTAFGDPARYAWDFGDGSSDSTTNSPTHLFTTDSTYNVCMTIWDPVTGDNDTYCEDVYVPDSGTVGTIELTKYASVLCYPNPAKDFVNIEFTLTQNSRVTISAESVTGEKVAVLLDKNQGCGHHSLSWNTEGLSKGVYFVRFVSEKATLVRKVVKE